MGNLVQNSIQLGAVINSYADSSPTFINQTAASSGCSFSISSSISALSLSCRTVNSPFSASKAKESPATAKCRLIFRPLLLCQRSSPNPKINSYCSPLFAAPYAAETVLCAPAGQGHVGGTLPPKVATAFQGIFAIGLLSQEVFQVQRFGWFYIVLWFIFSAQSRVTDCSSSGGCL